MRRSFVLPLSLALVLAARGAAAAETPRVHASGAVGRAVGEPQGRELGYGAVGDIGGELPTKHGVSVAGRVGGVALADGDAPRDPRFADRKGGLAGYVLGGLRAGRAIGPWADLGLGVVASGGAHFGVGARAGWDFALGRASALAAGPMLGYLHVLQPEGTLRPEDARLLSFGAHMVWGQKDAPPAVCADYDGDGVCDATDACPREAGPADARAERRGCPRRDSDGDGVFDDEDACPSIAGVRSSDPAKNGCPRPDRDQDLVFDDEDACPDFPGVRTADRTTSGCAPTLAAVRLTGARLVLGDSIHFDFNSPRIRSGSRPIVRRVATEIGSLKDVLHVDIEGHADRVGTDEYNLDLSRMRAERVRALLVEEGLDQERLVARAYGRTRPRTTERGAAREDRRVEFWIVSGNPQEQAPPAKAARAGGDQ